MTTNSSSSGQGSQTWSEDEHRAFLQGVRQLGRGRWREIAKHFVPSRLPSQIAVRSTLRLPRCPSLVLDRPRADTPGYASRNQSHAQKHFKRQQQTRSNRKHSSLFDIVNPDDPPSVSSRDNVSSGCCTISDTVDNEGDTRMLEESMSFPLTSSRHASCNSSFTSCNSATHALCSANNSFSSSSEFQQQYAAAAVAAASSPVPPDSVLKPTPRRVAISQQGAPEWANRLLAACQGGSSSSSSTSSNNNDNDLVPPPSLHHIQQYRQQPQQQQ